ncbi:Heme-dependent peroxidase [Glarea lozoyensis ATCC 20868]|uniref:Peroxidase n=1 Tax=Glarea lozoyensis (strain ATCC 20868 / MF5171) TaxID=1116229 RepID=S3CTY2_GLAL2|nr:Heme-dependent peroxidase [Glarea lozoyensis ATCC 20868]EPE28484.1 Heme-dependent peroxidase [Glarea lozoyensis ATCC 20868]
MFFKFLIFLSSLALAVDPKTVFDSNGISLWEKIEELERQLLDTGTLSGLVNPCASNSFADPNEGRQTSAEWVRIVFHDAITKGIAGPGLGGLDASVSFESERAENAGGKQFINVTIAQFNVFQSVYFSMADLIGVGLITSLATCDGTHKLLPLRMGRIDATGPGPAGVPGPADTLAFSLAAFNRAGFSQAEMIQSIACGHSLGGVHGKNFPDIGGPFRPDSGPDPANLDPTNTFGRKAFGTTPAAFDHLGIAEYLDGTGLKGGPLVVGLNDTENSDKRIFKSDGNVTMNALRSATAFRNTCFTVFDKMVNTVPAAVTLSDPVVVRPWTMLESQLDLTSTGTVNFTGKIAAHGTPAPPSFATYQYGTTGGGNTGSRTSQVGVVQPGFTFGGGQPAPTDSLYIGLGVIKHYPFWDALFEPVNSVSITTSGSTYTGDINVGIFVIPSMSFFQGTDIMLRVAVLSSLTTSSSVINVIAWSRVAQTNSLAFRIISTTQTLTFEKTVGSYKIYKTTLFSGLASPIFQASLGTNKSSKVKGQVFKTPCTAASIGLC